MNIDNLARSVVLGVAENKFVSGFFTKYGLSLGAGRFVAGSTLEDALETIKQLNQKGILATLDHLGENIFSKEEASSAAQEYLNILDAKSSAHKP